MKTIIRNFLHVIRHYRLATFLNVAGLSVAFAAFIVIMMQVHYQYSFEHCHKQADHVFRVDMGDKNDRWNIHPRAFVETLIASSPHILAGTLINPYEGDKFFTIKEEGERKGFTEPTLICHPDIVKLFDFHILTGDVGCLTSPDKVLISRSQALKFFGEIDVVGKVIHAEKSVWSNPRADYTIGGVYEDFPGNTQLTNALYIPIDPVRDADNWDSSNFLCYVLLDSPESGRDVSDNFIRNYYLPKFGGAERDFYLKFVSLPDIYFLNEDAFGSVIKSGNPQTARLLFVIAILIIVIAAINFTNFGTALTPMRVRSINTQKVLGSSDAMLRVTLLMEAVLMSLLSYFIALFIVWSLGRSELLSFLDADISLAANLPLLAWAALLAVGVGVVSGAYPAFYVTSFPPALALKGSFGLSPAGRKLRVALMGFQFIVSVGLIVASLFVQLQNHYIRHFSLGFDADQIAIVELNDLAFYKHLELFKTRIKDSPAISDVAFSQQKFAATDWYRTWTYFYHNQAMSFYALCVSANFLSVMNIPVIEGRMPTESDEQGTGIVYWFNKTAAQQFGIQAGERVEGDWMPGPVAGLVDVQFTSLRREPQPMAFVINEKMFRPYAYIRVKAGSDIYGVVDHIYKVMKEIDPAYPATVEFYDSVFDQLYRQEGMLNKMILSFSLLAVIISIVGVFGLVIFETQYRRKEIGIRKVHGASGSEILWMFNKTYFRLIVVCSVIALPVVYIGIRKWLEGFAYKTPIYGWVFLAGFALVAVVTLATVTFQSWRAANDNPVDSIKSE